MRPDVYIMSGSARPNKNVLPFGYNSSPQRLAATFNKLIARNGLQQITPVKDGKVYGVYHHFYNHPYNIIGMEILAKDLYPAQFSTLNPTADFHQIISGFTKIPDEKVILSYSATQK